jgi:hypothetical protein
MPNTLAGYAAAVTGTVGVTGWGRTPVTSATT